MKKPKGVKGTRRQLRQATQMTAAAVKHAMLEASKAIDEQGQQVAALHRVLISERAQLIYYVEKYRRAVTRESVELAVVPFLELSEAQQEIFIKQAVKELAFGAEPAMVPHDTEALKAAFEPHDTKILLN